MSASTNAQPVDVLAALEVAERFATAYTLPNTAGDFAEARAAVAELVEAARDFVDATGEHSDARWDALKALHGVSPIKGARVRLAAALAGIGGGA